MNTPTHIRAWCYPVLPLVFDDSLSYYEFLCKVSAKLNELIDYTAGILEAANQYTDEEIAKIDAKVMAELEAQKQELQRQMNELLKQVQDIQQDLLNRMAILEQNVNDKLSRQQQWVIEQIADLDNEVAIQISALKRLINEGDESVRQYVDREIQKVIDMIPEISNPKVVNPFNGELEPLQQVIDQMVDVFKYFAWSAGHWDFYGETAGEFDASGITAWRFDIYGMKILHSDWRFLMRSPVTGEFENYKNVILWLIGQHMDGALTSEEFNALALTVAQFEGFQIDAFNYDFHGKELLKVA